MFKPNQVHSHEKPVVLDSPFGKTINQEDRYFFRFTTVKLLLFASFVKMLKAFGVKAYILVTIKIILEMIHISARFHAEC